MNVMYCGDRNIADGVLISVLSLAKVSKEPIHVYLLTAHVVTDQKDYLPIQQEFADGLLFAMRRYQEDCSVELLDITELFRQQLPIANMNTRFTPCCMLRLFADLLPELPDRVLYLDSDVICREDLSDFYNQEMDDFEIAGCLDYYGSWLFRKKCFRRDYLNSGVLLLNLEKIRSTRLFESCRDRCRNRRMFMPDQSAINKLSEHKKICDRRFNEQRKLRQDTVCQHFTTSFRVFPIFHKVSVKPWETDRMHSVLKLKEYDDLLEEYLSIKESLYEF